MSCFLYYQSYDATTHFESTVADVLEMYTKITGKVNNKLITMFLGSQVYATFWNTDSFLFLFFFFCRLLICLWT